MKTRILKSIIITAIPVLGTIAVAYMQIKAEERRGWERYTIMRDWAEEQCEDDEQAVSGQQQE